ncbi:Hybrid peroxiredoxin hyPrx5 [Thalassocella blandensis]|nr:Hybrid peroxiredoxin hyPrx5 [Thalassocella blandensis]
MMQTNQKHAILYRMVTDKHICPYGIKSRDLLQRQGFSVEDHLLSNRDATEVFKREHGVSTTPQTFIEGQRVGGYDELKSYFNISTQDDRETTFVPVIAIFVMSFLMALAFSFRPSGDIGLIAVVEIFVALSMCGLAIQKLRNLEAFSIQFVTYDLIAMRHVRYAYLYAYLEAFAGLGMLAMLPAWLVSPPALLIGVVGATSVFKAVYLDKRELKCACVGGNSHVPLGFVSLTENLMMVSMGIWMLVK